MLTPPELQELRRIEEEWRAITDALPREPDGYRRERTFHYGVRHVLVHLFGDRGQFFNDPEFHARVCAAEQRLMYLRDLERRASSSDSSAA